MYARQGHILIATAQGDSWCPIAFQTQQSEPAHRYACPHWCKVCDTIKSPCSWIYGTEFLNLMFNHIALSGLNKRTLSVMMLTTCQITQTQCCAVWLMYRCSFIGFELLHSITFKTVPCHTNQLLENNLVAWILKHYAVIQSHIGLLLTNSSVCQHKHASRQCCFWCSARGWR